MTDLEAGQYLQKFYDVLASIATSLDSIATRGDVLESVARQLEAVADGVSEINQESITTFKQKRQHHADLMACLEKLTESK